MSPIACSEPASTAMSFAVSSELPPPIDTTPSTPCARASATAARIIASGGSATTSEKVQTSMPAASRPSSAASARPSFRIIASVTKATLRQPRPAMISPIFAVAPDLAED